MKVRTDMITCFVVRPAAAGWEFLRLRRVESEGFGGTWQTIRGRIEPGETAVAAALREIREEAGLRPREFFRLGTVETFYLDDDDTIWHSPAFCALVDPADPVVLNREHDAHRWVPLDALADEVMWASERNLVPHLVRDVLADGPARPYLRIDLGPAAG